MNDFGLAAGYVGAFVIGYFLSMLAAVGLARLLFPRIDIDESDLSSDRTGRQFPVSRKLRSRIHRNVRRSSRTTLDKDPSQ